MDINIFSVIMALVLFTVVSSVCSWLLLTTKSSALWIVDFVFTLCIIRCLIPIEFAGVHNVNLWNIYPQFFSFLKQKWVFGLRIWEIAGWCWFIGSVFSILHLLYLVIKQIRFNASLTSTAPDARLARIAEKAASAVGCTVPVRVTVTSVFSSPIISGFIHPTILLPEYTLRMDDSEIEYILRHELAHFTGGDLWRKLAVQLLVCILWWNPAAYLLRRGMNQLLELRADRSACVLMNDSVRDRYINTLLFVARKAVSLPKDMMYAGFIGKFDALYDMQRIDLLIEKPTKKNRPALTFLTVLLCVSVFIGSYTFIVQPAALPPESGDPTEVIVTPENAWLVPTADGKYEIWVDGAYYITISAAAITVPPFSQLPIKEMASNQ